MKGRMTLDLSLRGLVNLVAKHGRGVDEAPRRLAQLARSWGLGRPHLYKLMSGLMRPSDGTLKKLITGMRKIAPWVTVAMVEAAVEKSQKLAEKA